MSMPRTTAALICIPLLASLGACRDLVVACPDPGPTWEVSPPELVLAIGQSATVSVVEVTCAGRRRVAVYPEMNVADTTVAISDPYYRHVRGRAAGSTTLTLVGQDVWKFNRTIPVTVR